VLVGAVHGATLRDRAKSNQGGIETVNIARGLQRMALWQWQNRTKVGLKRSSPSSGRNGSMWQSRQNRTKVGLKQQLARLDAHDVQLPGKIEPRWD
jgi:hypothetical protein